MRNKKTTLILLTVYLFCHAHVIAQVPRNIHQNIHHSLSLQPINSPIKFIHNNKANVSTAALGVQIRYSIHFPLNTLYSIGCGFYTGHNTYKFDRPYDPLGYLNNTQISGLISPIPGDTPFGVDEYFTFSTFGFPIYISGVFPISNSLLIIASMGLNINALIHGTVNYNEAYGSKYLIQTGSTELVVIRTIESIDPTPQIGFLIELGPQYTFRNGTVFSISLAGNMSFFTQSQFKYDLYPDLEEYKSSGFMETSGSYFGLSINYIFIKFLRR